MDWSATHDDYDGAPDAYDDRSVTGPTREAAIEAVEEWIEDNEPEPLDPEGDRGPNYEPDTYAGPPVGTHAYTAWVMSRCGIMDGDEADRWKDEAKEADLDFF
jgi:hypothetical protein